MCLIAFQKMFRKIFSDVWLCSWKFHKKHIFYLLLTFSHIFSIAKRIYNIIHSLIQKHKQNPEEEKNHQIQTLRVITIGAKARSRSARCFARSLSKLCAITINALRDRHSAGNVGERYRWARLWTISTLSSFFLPLSLSLALSLFCTWLGNGLKVKWKCKTISGSKE